MSTEILVNIGAHETRVALVEGGSVQEVYVQRAERHGLVGNLYKGRVERVLPGMQAAFIEIGLERTAFLHASDMLRPSLPDAPDTIEPARPSSDSQDIRSRGDAKGIEPPPINQLLSEGQDVLVQVLKDPLGSKGARLTTLLSLASRYLVLLPHERNAGTVGVSARIEDETERTRLRDTLREQMQRLAPDYGVIVRTAGEGADAAALEADVRFLQRLWASIGERAAHAKPGERVHADLPLSLRVLRDLLGPGVDRVRVDSAAEHERLTVFAHEFIPGGAGKIELYTGTAPLFDLYGVEDDLNRALDRRVGLKSGGHLVIDQTEAMTTVDVNTGGFTGHRNLEDTVLKTNLEAAQAIARQLRLRNLGGLIVLDFIDMRDESHRAQVLRALEKELQRDPARSAVHPFSPLGLIEMTRKRTRESLGHILCEPCAACQGRGTVKTAETVCNEIFRELQRSARQFESKGFLVIASTAVCARLQEEQALAEFEEQLHRPIRVQADPMYLQDGFDVVPL